MIPRGRRRDISARVGSQLRHAGWRLDRWGLDCKAPAEVVRRGPAGDTSVGGGVSGRRRWLGGPMPSLPDVSDPSFSEAMPGTLDHWTQELLADIQEGTSRTP